MDDDFKYYGDYSYFREYPDAPDAYELDGMQLAMGSQTGAKPGSTPDIAEDIRVVGGGMADIGAAAVKGAVQGFAGLPGDIEMIGRGVTAIFNRGGDESKVQAFLRGLQEETVLPNTEDIKKWLDTNVGKVGKGDNPYETIGEVASPGGYVKGAKTVGKGITTAAKEAAPIVNKMAEDYMRKTGLTMAVAPDSVTKQVTDLMPRVDSIERFPLGPTSIKPKVIAPDVPLHREMDAENLTDFLRNDRQFAYSPAFVTDNPDLAIGQGSNKGVKVKFRPNSISGEENVKPMTGAIAGREYRADVIAPRSIESITFASEAELKKVRSLAASVLKKDFERVTDGNKGITFVRKTQPTEIPVAPKTSTPEFKSWFGQSKVVDDKNKPMVVYHTGAFDADVIKSASQLATDADKASFKNKNNGIYFSKSATYSGMYGEGKQGATTYPVYLSIKNPLIIKSKADVTALGGIFNDTADSMFITPEKLKELKSKGYDGIVNDLHNEVVAFEPTQIKSVFNKGTFDPKDPRILYGGGAAGAGTAMTGKEKK